VVKNKQQLGMLQLKTGYKTGTAAAAALQLRPAPLNRYNPA
jgi:hypothetical protein